MIPKFSVMLRVDAHAALSPMMISEVLLQYCGTPRTERHTSKCKATLSERVLSSFLFPRTFYSQPKYGHASGESEKHQVSPSRPPTSISCVVHRKRLRAAGRLVINFLTMTVLRTVPRTSVISRYTTRDGLTVPAYLARFQRPDKK